MDRPVALTGVPDATAHLPPLLATRRLNVGIGARVFCRALDLELRSGESLAILGRNGAGKSTLLSVLAGLRAPLAGEVRLKGASYAELGPRQAARLRGWLPQSRSDAFASTVLETVLVGRHPHLDRWGWESARDAEIVRRALTAVGLADCERRDIQTLSGGERQRLAIATLLAQQPELFLLDEPAAYLDLKHQIAMLTLFSDAAREHGAAVAMVLHEPALAWRFSDRVLLVYGDGRCECGPAAEMLNAERLSSLYDYPLRVFERDGQLCLIPR
ncbi:MAG: ABC transporter ATP-binding protein [Candidatus Accumulibacter sp.]|jgi:iron complex transport system ATP-binding protein|nr:ABC transporter ATP-binding protein [Accumulibacter sp.]